MKILLINPPTTFRQEENVNNYSSKIPLGLAYIAAILEKNNYDVQILDSTVEEEIFKQNDLYTIGSFEKVYNKIISYKPDIVGISCIFSSRISNALKCARISKLINPYITTIMGGIHPTILPKEVLKHKEVDIVAIGEADYLILNILKSKRLEEIDGIGYKVNGKIIINPKTKWVQDLDSLPFPARHLLPMKKYLSAKRKLRANGKYTIRLTPRNSISTSRACSFNCRFCASHCLWGRKWRSRSPENVVAEIKRMIKQYGIKQVSFDDDNFSINRERLIKMCRLFIKEELNIKWDTPAGACILTMDRDLLTIMKKAGCSILNLAFESGNEYVLHKLIGKHHSLEKAREINSICKDVGIKVIGYFVIGMPGETEEMIQDSIDFAIELNLDELNVSIATPYVGTELYKECIENNYIEEIGYNKFCADDDYQRITALINTSQISAERLLDLYKHFYNEYNKRSTIN